MGCIYRWVNLINGKGYTGYSKDVDERDRVCFQPSNKKDSKSLKDAMAKYGKENFSGILLRTV